MAGGRSLKHVAGDGLVGVTDRDAPERHGAVDEGATAGGGDVASRRADEVRGPEDGGFTVQCGGSLAAGRCTSGNDVSGAVTPLQVEIDAGITLGNSVEVIAIRSSVTRFLVGWLRWLGRFGRFGLSAAE